MVRQTAKEPETALVPEVLSEQRLQHLNWPSLGALARARELARIRTAFFSLFQDALENPAYLNAIAAALSPKLATELEGRGLGMCIPSSHELDELVGSWMGLGGKPISGRMVRRYLALLSLPDSVQKAAGPLKECQLRALLGLKGEALQLAVVKAILSTQEQRSTPLRPWSFPASGRGGAQRPVGGKGPGRQPLGPTDQAADPGGTRRPGEGPSGSEQILRGAGPGHAGHRPGSRCHAQAEGVRSKPPAPVSEGRFSETRAESVSARKYISDYRGAKTGPPRRVKNRKK